MDNTYWIRKQLHRAINRITRMDIPNGYKLSMLDGFFDAMCPLTTELEWDSDNPNYTRIYNHLMKARHDVLYN